MKFYKYQALGNTYTVLRDHPEPLTPALIQQICDPHYGIASDGILLRVHSSRAPFGLRIFNPDGSPAEKSGNGLRIFARYLWDRGWVSLEAFGVETPGGLVGCQVRESGRQVFVEMGSARILHEGELSLEGQTFAYTAVDLGNPHCVLWVDQPTPQLARTLGPLVENHPLFPQRTNVQLARVDSPTQLSLEIWERGAGYTLASGSSSCAVAAVARQKGWCEERVTAQMPGGELLLEVSAQLEVSLLGPVSPVAEGELFLEGSG